MRHEISLLCLIALKVKYSFVIMHDKRLPKA